MTSAERGDLMRRAIMLSRRGYPAPNPHVGCVVARGRRILGEGFHACAGEDHAEVVALEQAGEAAKGSTVYVTLEPCAHHGRTPPCADALIAAGVRRVFIANMDPNPRAGGGAERLRAAGIDVQVGLMAGAATLANWKFICAHLLGRVHVTAKAAVTLEGFMAPPSGASGPISGSLAQRAGRLLRAECGAVLVGSRTVLEDDPRLTVREPKIACVPTRIVLDPDGALSGSERLFSEQGEIWRVGVPESGADVECPIWQGRFDLPWLAEELFRRGLTSVLVEGGPTTLGSFFEAGMVDSLELFVAPKWLGEGRKPWGEMPISRPMMQLQRARRLRNDVQLSYTIL